MKGNCCPDKDYLVAYRLGLLGQKERKLFESHLAACEQCRQAMKIEMEIDKELSTRLDPGYIEDNILRRLCIIKGVKFSPWWHYPLRVFLNTLAGFAFGYTIWIFIIKPGVDHAWFNNIINAIGNSVSVQTSIYISYGFGTIVLLAGLLFAFRKNLLKLTTAL